MTWAPFAVTQGLLWGASCPRPTAAVALVLKDRGFAGGAARWCGAFAWACGSMLVLEPARSGVNYGQIEFVLMFVVVADVLRVPPPYRGIAIGIAAAVKLTPLVFIVLFAVRRDWRSVARAVVTFVACMAVSWIVWPGLSRVYWKQDIVDPARIGTIAYGGNQSWFAVLHRPPFAASGSALGWVAVSLATAALGIFVAWRCTGTGRRSLAIIAVALVGLLVSPISWTHHWVWVILVPPMLLGPRRHDTSAVVRVLLWGIVAITITAPTGGSRPVGPATGPRRRPPGVDLRHVGRVGRAEYRAGRSGRRQEGAAGTAPVAPGTR